MLKCQHLWRKKRNFFPEMKKSDIIHKNLLPILLKMIMDNQNNLCYTEEKKIKEDLL